MSSYAYTIANAVVTGISGLSPAPAQTTFRKFDSLILADKLNAANIVCIVTLSDEQQVLYETFGNGSTDLGTIGKAYMVGVSLYKFHGGNIQSAIDSLVAMALSIEQLLNRPTLSGASTVVDCQMMPFQTFIPKNFTDGYEAMRGYFVFSSSEPRNG